MSEKGGFITQRIRVRKEDAAFVYFILESLEGQVSYSTLPHRVGDSNRDLELRIPPGFLTEVHAELDRLRHQDGVEWKEV